MNSRETRRYFIGVIDTAGMMSSLAGGLRDNGVDVFFLDLQSDRIGYREGERELLFFRAWRCIRAAFLSSRTLSKYNPQRYGWTALHIAFSIVATIWIAWSFDVIVLKAGQTFTRNSLDLKLFKFMRRTIVYVFCGSDSRPPYLIGYWDGVMSPEKLLAWTHEIKEEVRRVSPYADFIIDNPLSAHFQERKCIVFQCIGLSIEAQRIERAVAQDGDRGQTRGNGGIRILHAPSSGALKGTAVIRGIIERLREKGHSIDYVELSGVENRVVLRQISNCDLIIDELYSDTCGGVFAMEAATLGKAVVTGGYGKESMARFIPADAMMPITYERPENVEAAVEQLILDRDLRLRCGDELREFVVRRATPKHAAARLVSIVNGAADDNWFFDPVNIDYMGGVCEIQEKVKRNIRALVERGGPSALLLDDKPSLRDGIIQFSSHDDGLLAGRP